MSSSTRSPSPKLTEPRRDRVSAATARRIALAAQGFADPRPRGRVDRRHLRRVFGRIGLVQIDSVNVLVRSHELPMYSRLGPYSRAALAGMAGDGELFEYWGHAATLIPVEHFPLFDFRMRGHDGKAYGDLVPLRRHRADYVAAVLAAVAERGPLTANELEAREQRKGPWWDWSDAKLALEVLFYSGQVSARRRPTFEREYDLTERIIPRAIFEQPRPDALEARRQLLQLAARALGVATFRDLADYYRLNMPLAKTALASLVDEGRLVPVDVEGWAQPAYLHPDAAVPRRVGARALLTPFDSLVWERQRTERMFGFRYRIEIYTPAPKRVFGYYVLPFLLGDELVARVDLKADRRAGALLVPATWTEPGATAPDVADELAAELRLMASWLGLDDIVVERRGDLAEPLAAALGRQA